MRRIGIVPISDGAGASFLTAALALQLASKEKKATKVTKESKAAKEAEAWNGNSGKRRIYGEIAVVELGEGGMYDMLCADKWFQMRQVVSYWNCIVEGGQMERIQNFHRGVNWLMRTPMDKKRSQSPALDRMSAIKLIYSVRGEVGLFDFSSVCGDDLFYLMEDMDQLIAVVDPLPSQLLKGYERLYRLRLWKKPVHWVVNRYSEEVPVKDLRGLLGANAHWITIPEVPRNWLYRAEYGCCMAVEQPAVEELLAKGLGQLENRLT